MSATKSEAKWPLVVNLSNSIIGVSVLAMPFCMRECGLGLGTLLLVGSNLLTRVTSHLLFKGAFAGRRRSYEAYAASAFGETGRAAVQVSLALFLLSTLCAFYVVIGDLGPSILVQSFGLEDNSKGYFRIVVMCLITLWIIIPLSLLRSLDSLASVSSCAIFFYAILVLRMLLLSVPSLLRPSSWLEAVNWWRPGGVLQCLPILVLSLSCQTQLFVTAEGMQDPTPGKLDSVVAGAVNLCTAVYLAVGYLGYIVFHAEGAALGGDVLVLLEPSALTQLLKLGFILSVAVSFPLILFPIRQALYTLAYGQGAASADGEVLIPEIPFRNLTLALVAACLLVGIWIPNVELVLGLTGALIGSSICVCLPSLLFLYTAPQHQFYSRIAAQACLVLGAFIAIVCTYATLHAETEPPPLIRQPQPIVSQAPPSPVNLSKPLAKAVVADVAALADKKAAPVGEEEKAVGGAIPAPAEPDGKKGSGEAAALLAELKEQRKEQEALIKEQKEILQQLKKDHPKDTRLEGAAKTKAALRPPPPPERLQQPAPDNAL